jgi:hypothetical protein
MIQLTLEKPTWNMVLSMERVAGRTLHSMTLSESDTKRFLLMMPEEGYVEEQLFDAIRYVFNLKHISAVRYSQVGAKNDKCLVVDYSLKQIPHK